MTWINLDRIVKSLIKPADYKQKQKQWDNILTQNFSILFDCVSSVWSHQIHKYFG